MKKYLLRNVTRNIIKDITKSCNKEYFNIGGIIKNHNWDKQDKIVLEIHKKSIISINYDYLKDPTVEKFYDPVNKIYWKYVSLSEAEYLYYNIENVSDDMNKNQLYFLLNDMIYFPNVYYSSNSVRYNIYKIKKIDIKSNRCTELTNKEQDSVKRMIMSVMMEGVSNLDKIIYDKTDNSHKSLLVRYKDIYLSIKSDKSKKKPVDTPKFEGFTIDFNS